MYCHVTLRAIFPVLFLPIYIELFVCVHVCGVEGDR